MKIAVLKPADATTKVFQYGVRINTSSIPKVREQLFLAHETYNNIVAEIKRIDKTTRQWLQERAGSDAQRIWEEIQQLNTQWSEAKATDDRDKLKEIAEARRGLWRAWYPLLHQARKDHKEEIKRLMAGIGERSDCTTYQIRSKAVKSGLGWATANAVLKAALQAQGKQWPTFKEPNFRRAADVPHRVLELQFTDAGGIGIIELFNNYREISIIPATAGKRVYTPFRMALGAGESKEEITGTVQYHRPLPPEARIKYARLVEYRIGKDTRYYLQFVVTGLVIEEMPESNPNDQSLAALDFGWYYEDDGRRIAGFGNSPDADKASIIRLAPEIDGMFDHAEQKKTVRDTLRDEIAAVLKSTPEEVFYLAPPEIAEALLAIRKLPAQHIAHRKLAGIVNRWRQQAVDLLPPILEQLELWRRRDKQLWQDESHISFRARNRRKKQYEDIALSLVRRHRAIVIDTPELAETAKVKDKTTGKHNKLGGVARSGRHRVALYSLQSALLNVAARCDTPVAKITGRTSKICSVCGGSALPPDEGARTVVCQDCGVTLDREANAAAVVWQQADAQREEIFEQYGNRLDEKLVQFEKRSANKQKRQTARSESARIRREGKKVEVSQLKENNELAQKTKRNKVKQPVDKAALQTQAVTNDNNV